MTNKALLLNPPFLIKNIFSLNWIIVLRTLLILSLFSILSLLVFYIFQVNAEVSERYSIQKYDKELTQNLKENQNLEINLIQSNNLDNIAVLMEEFNFEKINKIHYIRVLGNKVVTK